MENFKRFKTVNEFCEAIKNGKTVYWRNSDYVVKFDDTDKFYDSYYIYCTATNLRLNALIYDYHSRIYYSPEFNLGEYFVK